MDGKKLKTVFIICLVLFVVYLCLPWENGNSEGAVLRNHIRREKVLPWNVKLIHIEDLSLQDGQENMRAVIFKEKEDYILQWYQMDEEGNYRLYKNAYGNHHNTDESVVSFPKLYMDFYEQDYELYFVEDERVEQVHLFYDYKIRDGKEIIEEGNIDEIYSVKDVPQLLCVPDMFAKLIEKGGNGIGGSIEAVGEDVNGNSISYHK